MKQREMDPLLETIFVEVKTMMNEGREFIHTQYDSNACMNIENIAAAMLDNSGDKNKYSAYINACADRDKFVDDICKNIDIIKSITDKCCNLDTHIAMLDACIDLLDNIQRLNVVSFHIGFMTNSALGDTTGIDKK